MSFLGYASQYKVKENVAVNEFSSALKKQLEAVKNGKLTRRSWAKPEGDGYLITLGKLPGTYSLPDKEEAVQFLSQAVTAARADGDFIEEIEKAYGATDVAPKRTRKPRAAKTEG